MCNLHTVRRCITANSCLNAIDDIYHSLDALKHRTRVVSTDVSCCVSRVCSELTRRTVTQLIETAAFCDEIIERQRQQVGQ